MENENLNAALQFEGTLAGIERALRGMRRRYSEEQKKEVEVQTTSMSDAAVSEIMALLRSIMCVNTVLSNANSDYVNDRTFDAWFATFNLLNSEMYAGRIGLQDREMISELVKHAVQSTLLRALDGRERELFFKTQQTNIHLSSPSAGYTPSGVK